uniref:Uncharacterized protein n=1 Tax=Amazona collaria TaxID=241587 RepID=A0A8B9FUC6_9PSIT
VANNLGFPQCMFFACLETATWRRPMATKDGLVDIVRCGCCYEKPCRQLQRLAYEVCRQVYGTELGHKISFLVQSNQQDPWLGC